MSEILTAAPQGTTLISRVLDGGRLVGPKNSSMWCYRAAPLSPIQDARDSQKVLEASVPILRVMEQLAALAHTTGKRRQFNRDSYRDLHLLLLNIPTPLKPNHGLPNADMLTRDYGDEYTFRRLLLVGTRLLPKMTRAGKGRVASAVESVSETFLTGGIPVEDFEDDYQVVDAIFRQAGMRELGVDTFGRDELALARGWWNFGDTPDVPILLHDDHIHVCRTISAAQMAADMDPAECENWRLPSQAYALTLASAAEFDLPWIDATSARAQWGIDLVLKGARAISIRGKIEPAQITRAELARGRDNFRKDREDRVAQGLMSKAEQDQQIEILSQVEAAYGTQGGTPTLIDTSIVVALDRVQKDVGRLMGDSSIHLGALPARQQAAFEEMKLCSNVKAAPRVHELPAQTIACAGLANLSTVGDTSGALLGLTEADQQPAYISPFAATKGDGGPLLVVAGGTGSGKLLALTTRIPTPTGWTTVGQLNVGDEVLGRDGRPCRVTDLSAIERKPHLYRLTLSDGQHIDADSNHQWVVRRRAQPHPSPSRHCVETSREARDLAWRLCDLADDYDDEHLSALEDLWEIVNDIDATPWRGPNGIHASLRMVDVAPRSVPTGAERNVRDGRHPRPSAEHPVAAMRYRPLVYSTKAAIRGLAIRVQQQHADEPSLDPGEVVMSTGEMLDQGVSVREGDNVCANFSIRLPRALDLPDAVLPVDPYSLGVWLGGECAAGGSVGVPVGDRIPAIYQRASRAQRLALLQGLMDERGRVGHGGECELAVEGEGLAGDVLELVRGLGIKASMSIAEADAGHRVGMCYRVGFTTVETVFRVAEKARLVPRSVGEDQLRLGITGIEAVAPRACRCLSVDSPDHTYLVEGFVPSHNTMTLLSLVRQWAHIPTSRGWRTPIVMIDAKPGSDFSEPVRKLGGQVMSLDDLASADGVFDPIRTLIDRTSPESFANTIGEAVELASQMISSIDPWGGDLRGRFEVDLLSALRYGVEHGGTCVGEALRISDAATPLPDGLLTPILRMLEATPLARAILGFSPNGQALRQAEGLSLIMVGNARIALPDTGEGGWQRSSMIQRIGSWVLRMMVYGSAAAVAYREGVVVLDEAWQFMIGPEGKAELDRLSRLARSQQVLVVLASQKVSDFVEADLLGGISRGVILPLGRGTGQKDRFGNTDNGEAGLALQLFKLQATEQRLARLSAPATIEGSQEPNWNSMRALRDAETGEVIRGAIGLYVDLSDRVVPTQILIPKDFLSQISTTSTDVIAREQEKAGRLKNAEAGR